jgi:peroxiredoxin
LALRVSILALAVWLTAAVPPAAPQTASAPAMDVRALLREVDGVTRAVQTVSYTSETFGLGPVAGTTRRVRARVLVRKLPDEIFPQIRAEIEGPLGRRARPGATSLLVCDGKRVAHVFHDDKLYESGALPEAGTLLEGFVERLFMREFVHPTPFGDEIEADIVEYEGVHPAGGVDCHVVRVVYETGGGVGRWYFGVEDKLPRRVDRLFSGAGVASGRALELFDLRVGVTCRDEDFVAPTPEGYRQELIESRSRIRAEPRLLLDGAPAPRFTLVDTNGQPVELGKLRGRVVVLVFWAAWHAPATNALLALDAIAAKHDPERIAFIALQTDEKPEADVRAVTERTWRFPLVLNADSVARAYRVDGVPTFYVIGPTGRVVYSYAGPHLELDRQLEEAIRRAEADGR